MGEVMSGNTSDMTFNIGWIKTVCQALQKSDDDFLLYTADSAAVTEELINQAITANIWTEIGTLSELLLKIWKNIQIGRFFLNIKDNRQWKIFSSLLKIQA